MAPTAHLCAQKPAAIHIEFLAQLDERLLRAERLHADQLGVVLQRASLHRVVGAALQHAVAEEALHSEPGAPRCQAPGQGTGSARQVGAHAGPGGGTPPLQGSFLVPRRVVVAHDALVVQGGEQRSLL